MAFQLPPETAANISILFTELPYLERPAAASAAGFSAIETWWPFHSPAPTDTAVQEFVDAVLAADVSLIGLNFWAGDMPGGERGVACLPDRRRELEASLEPLLKIARATGVAHFNLLFGQPNEIVAEQTWRSAGTSAVQDMARAVDQVHGTVLIESLAAGLNGTYPLRSFEDSVRVANEAGARNVAPILDTFHLGANGVDLPATARNYANRIGHVQLADNPGRGEPGSGELPLRDTIDTLLANGYAGRFALEYKPTVDTERSLLDLQYK